MRACLSPCLSQSLSLSFTRSSICIPRVYVCVGADSDSLKSLSGHRQIYSIHPPLLPLPLPLHTHTLSRAADHGIVIKLYTILGAHRHRHNTPAGQSSGLFVPVRVSVCLFVRFGRLASQCGHTFNQFTLKHQQLHYVTRRHCVPRLQHCVLCSASCLALSLSLFDSLAHSGPERPRSVFTFTRQIRISAGKSTLSEGAVKLKTWI